MKIRNVYTNTILVYKKKRISSISLDNESKKEEESKEPTLLPSSLIFLY